MEESWPLIQLLERNTRATATWCPAVCTVVPEEPVAAKSLPACALCCSITAVSSCRDHPIPSPNWRACALTPLPYIHSLSICSEIEPRCKLSHLMLRITLHRLGLAGTGTRRHSNTVATRGKCD